MKLRKVTKKWTTGTGEKIRICDMSDRHLENAIRWCERAHEVNVMAGYGVLSVLNGEIAQDCCERDLDLAEQEGPAYTQPLYDDLVEERERRHEREVS